MKGEAGKGKGGANLLAMAPTQIASYLIVMASSVDRRLTSAKKDPFSKLA